MTGVLTKGNLVYEDVIHLQTKRLKVTSEAEVHWHADAELGGVPPVTMGIKPAAIRVFCPEITDPKELLEKGKKKVKQIVAQIKARRESTQKRPKPAQKA